MGNNAVKIFKLAYLTLEVKCALVFIDIRAGAKPFNGFALVVLHGQGAGEVPAINAVRFTLKPHFRFVWGTGSQAIVPVVTVFLNIIGVQHHRPSKIFGFFQRKAGIIKPVAVVIIYTAIRVRRPDDLGDRIGQELKLLDILYGFILLLHQAYLYLQFFVQLFLGGNSAHQGKLGALIIVNILERAIKPFANAVCKLRIAQGAYPKVFPFGVSNLQFQVPGDARGNGLVYGFGHFIAAFAYFIKIDSGNQVGGIICRYPVELFGNGCPV